MKKEWKPISNMPYDGKYYPARINDDKGMRNLAELTRQGNLFFLKDGTYIYYTPTEYYD